MLNTDILERKSWRVMEDDSKEEKSRRDVGTYKHDRQSLLQTILPRV